MADGNREINIAEVLSDPALPMAMETPPDAQVPRRELTDEDEVARLRAATGIAAQERRWMAAGHGLYMELFNEMNFFAVCNVSERVIAHFYRPSTRRCDIVDKHMSKLALRHFESKFLKINVEKAHLLIERLDINTIPTIVISVDGRVIHRLVGFVALGGVDNFTTEMLAWRIGQVNGLNYDDDLSTPPTPNPTKTLFVKVANNSPRDGNKYRFSDI